MARCLSAAAWTGSALAHGDVIPQSVDTHTLPRPGDIWHDANPYSTGPANKEALRIGTSAYNQNCARCHGLEAISGGMSPACASSTANARACTGLASVLMGQQGGMLRARVSVFPSGVEAAQAVVKKQAAAYVLRSQAEAALAQAQPRPAHLALTSMPLEGIPENGWPSRRRTRTWARRLKRRSVNCAAAASCRPCSGNAA